VDGFSPTRFGRTVYARNLFDTFAQRFSRTGDTRITAAPTVALRNLGQGFQLTEAMVTEFRQHVEKSGLAIDEEAWKQDLPFIRAMIRFEIDLDLFGFEVARQNLSKADPQLQHALTLFPEAEALMQLRPAPDRRARN
jgi:hypothetical protein